MRPDRLGSEQREWLEQARDRAGRAGFFIKTLTSRVVPVLPNKGRRMNVLDPGDASHLYRRLHIAPTLVVSVGSTLVSTDPTRDPPNRRASRTLEEFVAYKATYGLIRKPADVGDVFKRFELWVRGVNCEGPRDPRALPLHVFDQGSNSFDLVSSAERGRFRRSFGPPNDREDGSGRRWERGAPHGGDALRVAGAELPAGTHWDVSSTSRSFQLLCSGEVWEVRSPGYLNVYPDEHVRSPRKKYRHQIRRLWPKKNAPH